MLQLKFWIVIKQSTNLELKDCFWVDMNVKDSHTHNNNHMSSAHKKVSNQTDLKSHNALGPPKVSPLQA